MRRLAIVLSAVVGACMSTPSLSQSTSAAVDDGARRVRGVTRAEAAAVVSSELVARITSLPFKPGQPFKEGDVLIAFDCARYEADVRAAQAEVRTQQINVETNRQLLRHRATGANDLALAEAKLAQAAAAADSLRVRTSQCVITAPYDGRIVERSVDIFEMPAANAPLMKIVKDGWIDIDLIVPSTWLASLRPGVAMDFHVEETGGLHKAVLQHVGAVVDPVSRTIRVIARLVDPGPDVRPGMSGFARLSSSSQDRTP